MVGAPMIFLSLKFFTGASACRRRYFLPSPLLIIYGTWISSFDIFLALFRVLISCLLFSFSLVTSNDSAISWVCSSVGAFHSPIVPSRGELIER